MIRYLPRVYFGLAALLGALLSGCSLREFLKGDGSKGSDLVPFMAVLFVALIIGAGATMVLEKHRPTRAKKVIGVVLFVAMFVVVALGLVLFALSGTPPPDP